MTKNRMDSLTILWIVLAITLSLDIGDIVQKFMSRKSILLTIFLLFQSCLQINNIGKSTDNHHPY